MLLLSAIYKGDGAVECQMPNDRPTKKKTGGRHAKLALSLNLLTHESRCRPPNFPPHPFFLFHFSSTPPAQKIRGRPHISYTLRGVEVRSLQENGMRCVEGRVKEAC